MLSEISHVQTYIICSSLIVVANTYVQWYIFHLLNYLFFIKPVDFKVKVYHCKTENGGKQGESGSKEGKKEGAV